MASDFASQVKSHLLSREGEMSAMLDRLVRLESPSDDPVALKRILAVLAELLGSLGYRVRHIPGCRGGGNLLAIPRTRKKHTPIQLLIGHCDTVWPLGTLRDMPAEARDGAYHGPGSFDMKAGLVQGLFALGTLRELGVEPLVAPVFFIDSDEETGSAEAVRHLRRLARIADRALVLEPALGDRGALKTARKGGGEFIITVKGRAAHAGMDPEKGASAILALAGLVRCCHDLNDPAIGVSVNVGMIHGGTRRNVVAAEAVAEVDFRALTTEDLRRVEALLRDLRTDVTGTTVRFEGGINHLPLERNEGVKRLWSIALEGAAALGLTIEEGTSGGASDGNTTAPFTPTLDGLGPVGDGAHAHHEHVRCERMWERSALLTMLLVAPALQFADRPGKV